MSKSAIAEVTGKMPFAGKHVAKFMFQTGRENARGGSYQESLPAP
ncbi:MAG TPA: hypothetical protein VFK11_01430 [Candidatus Saccharimonadales bacterium]|nr:hypothetical protein [Candidatus Saccharimonadales bacterium]